MFHFNDDRVVVGISSVGQVIQTAVRDRAGAENHRRVVPIADHDLHLASGEENGVLAARRIVPIAETAVGRTREGDTTSGLID